MVFPIMSSIAAKLCYQLFLAEEPSLFQLLYYVSYLSSQQLFLVATEYRWYCSSTQIEKVKCYLN